MLRYLAAPAYVLGMMAVTVGPLLYAPYTGPAPEWWPRSPVAVAKPVEPAKRQGRLDAGRIRPRPVTVEVIRQASVVAMHEKSTLPWSCDTIRAHAGHLSRKERERLGRVLRLTKEQQAEAERCLSDDPCASRRYDTNRKAFEAGRPQPC